MLKNPGALKKFRVMGSDEPGYIRPAKEYEIPRFHEGMPHCTSNEKYLRPCSGPHRSLLRETVLFL